MILYFLIALAIILETVFFPYPFTLLLMLVTVIGLGRKCLNLLFLTGIILDIFKLSLIGTDSLIFLILAAILLRYDKKIHFGNLFYVFVFIFTAIGLYSLYFYQLFFNPAYIIMTVVLPLALLYLIPYVFAGPSIFSRKLSV